MTHKKFKLFLILLLSLLAGCGGSGTPLLSSAGADPAFGEGLSSTQATPTSTVRIQSVLGQIEVPLGRTAIRATGYDSNGNPVYGPVTEEYSPLVDFQEVPVTTLSMTLEWLNGDQVLAFSQIPVQLQPDGLTIVDDFTVFTAAVLPQSLRLVQASLSLPAGTTEKIAVLADFSDGTTLDLTSAALYSVDDTSLTTVDGGTVRALAPGNANVTIRFGELTTVLTVEVTDATLLTISVAAESGALPKGATQVYRAEGLYTDATEKDISGVVDWTSTDPTVATVDSGAVQAVSQGQTDIVATLGTISGRQNLTVSDAELSTLKIDGPDSVAKGFTAKFTLTGTFTDGSTRDLTSSAVWESADTTIVSVVEPGKFETLLLDTTTISADYQGNLLSSSLTVSDAVVTGLSVQRTDDEPLVEGGTTSLQAVATYSDGSTADATDDVAWASENDAVMTVGNSAGTFGQVEAVSAGTASITATVTTVEPPIVATYELTVIPKIDLTIAGGTHIFNTNNGTLDSVGVQGWDAVEHKLSLESFNLPSSAVLEVVGNYSLSVHTTEGAVLEGRLDLNPDNAGSALDVSFTSDSDIVFSGAIDSGGGAGAEGSSIGADGKSGTPGGSVILVAFGSLTVDGSIVTRGGDGGTGQSGTGSIATKTTGGHGGSGAAGGSVVLLGVLDLRLAGSILTDGGNGANAGNGASKQGTGGARAGDGGFGGSAGTIFLHSDATTLTLTGSLQSIGGNGGNGGNGGPNEAPYGPGRAGHGGAGGNGGYITSPFAPSLYILLGGTGGTPGTGSPAGNDGTQGEDGALVLTR